MPVVIVHWQNLAVAFANTEYVKGTFNDLLGYDFALPTFAWIFLSLDVDKNIFFWKNYPPLLVHVVIKRPLSHGPLQWFMPKPKF